MAAVGLEIGCSKIAVKLNIEQYWNKSRRKEHLRRNVLRRRKKSKVIDKKLRQTQI